MECFVVFFVFYELMRRFRGKLDIEYEDEGGNESGGELKMLGDLVGIFDDNIGSEIKEDIYLLLVYVEWIDLID